MLNNAGAVKKQPAIPANPLINKLRSVEKGAEKAATYYGVYKKCLFFLAMTIVGALLAVVFGVTGSIAVDAATDELLVEKFVIWMLLGSVAVFLVFPFLAFLVRRTIPVTGAIYCAAVGFVYAFIAVLDAEMGSYIVLALMLTVAVVTVMGFLFAKGLIRVTAKLRAVTTVGFTAMVTGGLLLALCSFVPYLREAIGFIATNPVLYLLGSITGVVIAVLFLLVDFDNIRDMVEKRMPEEYEWFASFSLAFTVVWVYLKILHLIMQVKDAGK